MKILSFLVTAIFILLIAFQWHQQHDNYEYNEHKLVNETAVSNHLLDFETHESDQIATGVFVDSLKFDGENDVYLSGYVWQEFSADVLSRHKPGIIFPNSVGRVITKESYRTVIDGVTVVGWYFEANLRQTFNYEDYPIDHKTVRIKLLANDFNSHVVLVPSLKSYDSTMDNSIFGISQDIVLAGWDINESFFDYVPLSFDTDFGLHDNHPRVNLPELTFNIVIERDFLSAFVINITLLLVSISLLYSLVIMMTSDEHLKSKFSASLSSAIGSCAGIFFVVLIAHINIREKFPGSGIVYIEYFYLLSYLFILVTIIALYMFNYRKKSATTGIFANDAILIKLGFWPLYTFCICLITWKQFY